MEIRQQTAKRKIPKTVGQMDLNDQTLYTIYTYIILDCGCSQEIVKFTKMYDFF